MNRRTFMKTMGALTAAVAAPVHALAAEMPAALGMTPLRWHKRYALDRACWRHRVDVIVGRKVEETTKTLTLYLGDARHYCVDILSENEDLTDAEKAPMIEMVMRHAREEMATWK